MQLLIRRSQIEQVPGGTQFELWARFDLTPEETALIQKYKVGKAVISEGNPERDRKRAAVYAVLPALFVTFFSAVFLRTGSMAALFYGILTFGVLVLVIYDKIREEVRINDIVNGRKFSCRSIFTLRQKEDAIKEMASKFRDFLETMKTWGGREIIDIEPGKAPVLRLIEPSHAAE